MEKKCTYCSSAFDTKNKRKKYCSDACNAAEYRKRHGPINKQYEKEYHIKNKEKRSLRAKELRKTVPNRAKNKKLLERYGISLVQYEEMVFKQDNKCKICNEEHKLHVDHCHKTGKVRGLLCNGCNRALGYFNDNILKLERAIVYLHEEKN